MIVSLLGTPFFPNPKGVLLLIEEIAEVPYKIDRMITHLKISGVLDSINGVVLGTFTDCGAHAEEHIIRLLDEYGVKLIAGIKTGHGFPVLTLAHGACYSIDPVKKTLVLTEQRVITDP